MCAPSRGLHSIKRAVLQYRIQLEAKHLAPIVTIHPEIQAYRHLKTFRRFAGRLFSRNPTLRAQQRQNNSVNLQHFTGYIEVHRRPLDSSETYLSMDHNL
jgi:hypothetical protein